MREKTAAVVIIGNEILTGKTEDRNAGYLVGELHSLGVALRRIVTIADDVEEIAATVRECMTKFDYVFTSGGVGPTHDDVTIEGIARAFGRKIVRHPELVAVIRNYFGSSLDEARLRMADAPEGSELIYSSATPWPVLATGNVYILPGVPEVFRAKFSAIRERFRSVPYHTTVVFTREDEFDLASRLNQVAALNPGVAIGSYPNFECGDYRVKITVEANEAEAVDRAKALLIKLLDPAFVVRTESRS
jgi:molybdenum cofactor synthesis domain-containing protein